MIVVFAKPPVPGRVKTRLAASIGDDAAARLAAAFLADTVALLRAAGRPFVVATTGATLPSASALGLDPSVALWLQGEGGLGQRQELALRRAIAGDGWGLALGADSPGLPLASLRDCVDALERGVDAVIGPAEDGGYYALGLRACPEGLLEGLPWSDPSTCAATIARLEARAMSVWIAPGWWDVDEPEDLDKLAALPPARCPATALALARLGRR